jgi:hypothetical protein
MCVRLCRLRHCGGHDGQCQCEGERDCCCVHCVGSKEINGVRMAVIGHGRVGAGCDSTLPSGWPWLTNPTSVSLGVGPW